MVYGVYIFACLSLHVLLVILHVILVAIYYSTLLKNPPAVSSFGHTAIVVASQVFSTVRLFSYPTKFAEQTVPTSNPYSKLYCAILVLVTQHLALRRNLHIRQTLSAIHDKSAAWLGLGASFLALARQRTLNTDVLGVLQIVLYLLLVFVVHITIPSTLLVAPGHSNIEGTYSTQLAHQYMLNYNE